MEETFTKTLFVGNQFSGKEAVFTFERVYFYNTSVTKYAISYERGKFMMVKSNNAWRFENPIDIPILCLPLENDLAAAIRENEA